MACVRLAIAATLVERLDGSFFLRTFVPRRACAETPPSSLKLFHPWPHLDLPGPAAARLGEEEEVALCDRVGIEHRIGMVGALGPPRRADAAVDHHMGDVNALRAE